MKLLDAVGTELHREVAVAVGAGREAEEAHRAVGAAEAAHVVREEAAVFAGVEVGGRGDAVGEVLGRVVEGLVVPGADAARASHLPALDVDLEAGDVEVVAAGLAPAEFLGANGRAAAVFEGDAAGTVVGGFGENETACAGGYGVQPLAVEFHDGEEGGCGHGVSWGLEEAWRGEAAREVVAEGFAAPARGDG